MFVLVFTKILKMLQYFRHPLYSRVEGILIHPGWIFTFNNTRDEFKICISYRIIKRSIKSTSGHDLLLILLLSPTNLHEVYTLIITRAW